MSKRRLVELCDIIVPMRDKPKVFVLVLCQDLVQNKMRGSAS